MANEEHLKLLRQGVTTWNQWRKGNPEIKPDLSTAYLSGVNLYTAYLNSANLSGASLSETKLGWANLYNANLSRAGLSRADLYGAYLYGANLGRADLSGADLCRANLSRADLIGADLSGANLSEAKLIRANLSEANLNRADLSGADIMQTILVRTNLKGANLTNCHVHGISAWDLKLEGANQSNLIITPSSNLAPDYNGPTIMVDNLEVAQFIYLLLSHKTLRGVLNSTTERGVLILGRFGDGGLEVLQSIAQKLREMKYLPIIFDFDRPKDRDYTEIVRTLAGLSRFVIVDLSGPSVPHELYSTVPYIQIPFVTIMEKNRNPYSMFVELLENDHVLKPIIEFTGKEQLINLIPSRIVAPAEGKYKERQKLLDQLFTH
jgi:uncharacterized protein YjbI with pentapeptide repeats